MKVNESIRVETIFDYKNGRRFQILIVNKIKDDIFTTHKDMMGRDYLKIKLSESDLMVLANEIRKNIILTDKDVKFLEERSRRAKLKLVDPEEGSDGT